MEIIAKINFKHFKSSIFLGFLQMEKKRLADAFDIKINTDYFELEFTKDKWLIIKKLPPAQIKKK